MPWENTEKLIRNGHRSPEEFQKDTLKTITLSEKEGIQAVIGKPKGKEAMEVMSYLFEKDKDWTVEKAKQWFQQHQTSQDRICAILPLEIKEKIAEKPLRIRGVALAAGISRNFNVYTAEELQAFAGKLVNAPMYIEHVAVPNAVGKVTQTNWDGQNLLYEAEVYDEELGEKIRKGLIQHVSVGADYETVDFLYGKVPHGLHNAEISLVAVPGIADANIQVVEKLHVKNAMEPIIAGEYILGFQQDAAAFLPEHFTTVWLDRENGILALMGKLQQQPETQRTMAIFFSKEKLWDQIKIQDWLRLHPDYMTPATSHTSAGTYTVETLLKKTAEPTIRLSEAVRLIESILPAPMVQMSWSLGPQRMCQELRKVILKLKNRESHEVDRSS
jgi:hypothetical protein